MPNTTRTSRISEDESLLIKFMLTQRGRPREAKAGLQRLCAHYERGLRLADPHEIKLLVTGLIWLDDTYVRRWAYKALAILGSQSDAELILARLKLETDFENQTWGIAALSRLAKDDDLQSFCRKAGIEPTLALTLAAHLFSNHRWMRPKDRPPLVRIDAADGLTLKWGALLAGYGRAPDNLFEPNHDNRIILGQLNTHPIADVAEYSVWGLWKNPDYLATDLAISLHDIMSRPVNVRRWINRLLTKSPELLSSNIELINDMRRDDLLAREGLALGFRSQFIPGSSKIILEWYDDEQEPSIGDVILEHMARFSEYDPEYSSLVEQVYRDAAKNGGVRRRLLAASQESPLYSRLRAIEAREQLAYAGIASLFPAPDKLELIVGDKVMGDKSQTTFGGPVYAQNVVGGSMYNSAHAAVQNMQHNHADAEILRQIVQLVAGSEGIDAAARRDVIASVKEVATTGSVESKATLLSNLKRLVPTGVTATAFTDSLTSIIDTVSGWIG